jgi:hypothetical protein
MGAVSSRGRYPHQAMSSERIRSRPIGGIG